MLRTVLTCLSVLFLSLPVFGQGKNFQLHHADKFEVVLSPVEDTTFFTGSVIFEYDNGMFYCDSAVWIKKKLILLKGKVRIDNPDRRIVADSVKYDMRTQEMLALGSYVEVWSRQDSLFAVGNHAFFQRDSDFFFMENRPTLFLNYPDSSRLIEVVADLVEFYRPERRAEASGNVHITSKDFNSVSGCAIMYRAEDYLELSENPVAHRGKSDISGVLIGMYSSGKTISRIEVVDSARALLVEPTDSSEQHFDRSRLNGRRIVMDFTNGQLSTVTCWGQAYSWYNPYAPPHVVQTENQVSGDTIRLYVQQEQLQRVDVIGGAIGTYLRTEKKRQSDSVTVVVTETDTVDYHAAYIRYDVVDSLITLEANAEVVSTDVTLDAPEIKFDTKHRLVEAYSADIRSDSTHRDSTLTSYFQPNPIPVSLKDKEDVIYGDYLEYSLDTKKGRIVKSKSKYETGFYYSKDIYREKEHIFYLSDGRYTTCDAPEPHYHFYSKSLKLIEDDRLIAKPVVFYVGRIPIFAIPYYVFPLKKGRHSGFLPFTIGNLEQGQQYVRNLGYYWAASEYWDVQGAIDYFQQESRLNFFGRLNYNKRYAFNGSISGNYGRSTNYDAGTATEFRTSRWTISGNHRQDFSPSFRIDARGSAQSDATYYNDFSTNLNDRLNRVVRSQLNFTKRFGEAVSISGRLSHDDFLDRRTRTDNLPSMTISLPVLRPFGEGSRDSEGKLQQKWYNNISVRYTPSLLNFSTRAAHDSLVNIVLDTSVAVDTVITVDTLNSLADTSLIPDTTIVTTSADTIEVRSRRHYARIAHNPSLTLPTVVLARYFKLTPSFRYSETWYKIFRTDQSEAAGIAPTTYRAYSYSMGASFTTKLYGTVYPNMFGLLGLRQVITPTISYSFTPEINKHPEVRSFAGGGPGSGRRSQTMSLSLDHVYQAKVRQGDKERTLELVSIRSNVNYDFEAETRKFSDVTTTFRSYLLPHINFDGNMVHSLYKPGTDELNILSPYLERFGLNINLNIGGKRFLFDDPAQTQIPRGADSLSQLGTSSAGPVTGKGWSLSATYSFNESGRGATYQKTSFLRFNLRFNLTPNTSVSYSHYYDIAKRRTVNNQVNLTRRLHAWTGQLFWVPIGSTHGYGFKLFVTAIPSIKFDNSQSPVSSGFFEGLR